MKRARIIYNPTSGREAFKKELPNVLQKLEDAGYEASAHATKGEGDATEAAKIAVERKYDLLVAAGGDGTINEVIHGLAEKEYRPKLAIIPTGTTNDFARALQIPRDISKAVDIITEGDSMSLDIGKVNEHYFINIAGGGKLTELTYDVPIKLKTMIGQLAYYVKGIEMLPSLKPARVKIEYDGNIIDEDIMIFLVSNSNSVGGFEKLAPNAKLDDGYFDLLILRKTNLAEFIRIVTLALRGAHLEDDKVIHVQAKHIKVTPVEQMQLNIDGEYGGQLPGEFINLKQHIEFIVPKSFKEKEN
ncbi:diacylglycerol kinase [Compostibacillus humi]|jgi:diacylglycerol kinase (ATP)|uniref:Diacylglycerol kinase n=1 Tax=Compostibacillus humi TaxID=1245525 RepID=A0A8J3EJW9_9BACI|nr:diacylglycerol kinase [Compostibacillus humi]GGH73726.1 diacylglycerol kinase [Compostibacillus humi]